jgi:hypothetical protein
MDEAVFHLRRRKISLSMQDAVIPSRGHLPLPSLAYLLQIAPIGPVSDLGRCSFSIFRKD